MIINIYSTGMSNKPLDITNKRKDNMKNAIFSPETFWLYSINAKKPSIKKATINQAPPKTSTPPPEVPKIDVKNPIFRHL